MAQWPKWRRDLDRLLVRARGEYAPCTANVIAILSYDPTWAKGLAYDTFLGDITFTRPPPFVRDLARPVGSSLLFTERDMARMQTWLARSDYHINPPIQHVVEGCHVVAEQQMVHPIQQRLKSLKWDRKKRLDDFLIRYAGVEDSVYTRAVTSKWMISAVARAFQPGCQADSMLVLEGEKGRGKTSLLRLLALEPAWLLETPIEIGTKDAYQSMLGKWIVLFDEMDSIGRSDLTRMKAFITERHATYRPSYARKTSLFPRQCVLAASTNEDRYLKEEDRRFWPLKVPQRVDLKALEKVREQLWAEARVRYDQGETWHIEDELVLAAQREATEARRQAHPWEAAVARWLAKLGPARVRDGVTTYEVLVEALGKEVGDLTRSDEMAASAVLKEVGWGRCERVRRGGVRCYVYFPTDDSVSCKLQSISSGFGQKVRPLRDRSGQRSGQQKASKTM